MKEETSRSHSKYLRLFLSLSNSVCVFGDMSYSGGEDHKPVIHPHLNNNSGAAPGTAFSVTDILSCTTGLYTDNVADEALKKASLDIPPIFPSSAPPAAAPASQVPTSVNSMSSMAAAAAAANSMAAANAAYNWGQSFPSTFQQPYCNSGADFAAAQAYSDPMRSSTSSWYSANADPRIASK